MPSERVVPLSRTGATFARFFNLVKDDLFKFANVFNFYPTDQQAEIMRAVQGNAVHGKPTHIAVKSGQGPGKTAVSTVCGLWKTFRRHCALTVVTAPTMRQCKEVWLAEARQRIGQAPKEISRLFDCRATEIEILGVPDWGVKLASASRAENMQGWHNPHLTFLVDEASGVARGIIETIFGTLTNRDKLLLLTGNPNLRASSFFDCFNSQRHRWHTITMNAEESPIVDKANVRRLEEIYGRDSDVFRVRVLGEFPSQDPNCVMSSEDLEACTMVDMAEAVRRSRARQFGLDFARYGDDANVVYRRSGLAIVESFIAYKCDPNLAIGRAFDMQKAAGWANEDCWYVPDAGGIGQGVMHSFYSSKKRVFEFHAEGKPYDPTIYDDAITEAFFGMAQSVKKRIARIPHDNDLIAQLANRQYYLTKNGLIKIESKEDYRDRVQEGSPDKADACVQAFYDNVSTPANVGRLLSARKRENTYVGDSSEFANAVRSVLR